MSHIGWSALRSWGERLTTLALFVILARLLPPDQIGALAYVMAINSLILVVADGALSEWLIRTAASTREQETTIFTLQGLVGLVLAVLFCIVGVWWGPAMIGRSDAAEIIAALSLTIPLGAMTKVPEALLQRRFAFKQLAYRTFIVLWGGGVVGVSCALAGFGIWSLVLKSLVESIGYLIFTLLAANWRIGIALHFSKITEALRYGMSVFGSWLFEMASQRFDTLIVGSILGAAALGYYSIALRIVQVIADVFTAVISRVSLTHFSALARQGTEELSRFYLSMFEASTRLIVPLIAVFAALSPLIVPVVFGQKWTAAAVPLEVLCLIPLCTTATCFAYPIVLATGRPHYAMQLSIVAAVVTVIGASVGASFFGITGASIGVASRMLIVSPLALLFVSRVTTVSLRQHAKALWPVVLEAVIGFSVAFMIQGLLVAWPAFLRLVVAGLGGVAVAYGVLWLVLRPAERERVLRLIGQIGFAR
jgi:O-antigen/teichoic acid export membrane protein